MPMAVNLREKQRKSEKNHASGSAPPDRVPVGFSYLTGRLLDMPTELVAHGREQLVGELGLTA